MSNCGVQKGCKCIDSPNHKHFEELLDILTVFCEWKSEVGKNTDEYITWQSHEGLCWLVFSLVGISKTYLKEDCSRVMVQRRAGTDDCEHEFAGIKVRNQKPTLQDAREITARRTGSRTSCFTTVNKSNTSGDKTIYIHELTETIKKKAKKN